MNDAGLTNGATNLQPQDYLNSRMENQTRSQSERILKYFSDPANRAKHSIAMQKVWARRRQAKHQRTERQPQRCIQLDDAIAYHLDCVAKLRAAKALLK